MDTEPMPVVLVHGMRISGASMHRIAAAMPGRVVRTPDLPGHGARSRETFTMNGAVETISATIDDVGGRAVVAGLSLGGFVAMATAARHPGAVAGLVAMGATAQPGRLFAAPFRAFGAVTARLPKESTQVSRWITRVVVGRQVSDDMEIGGLAVHSIADVVEGLAEFDALGAVHAYDGPVRYINGGRDQFRVHEQKFLAASPGSELVVLPKAMHLFPLIQPDRTGELIDEFAGGVDAVVPQAAPTSPTPAPE